MKLHHLLLSCAILLNTLPLAAMQEPAAPAEPVRMDFDQFLSICDPKISVPMLEKMPKEILEEFRQSPQFMKFMRSGSNPWETCMALLKLLDESDLENIAFDNRHGISAGAIRAHIIQLLSPEYCAKNKARLIQLRQNPQTPHAVKSSIITRVPELRTRTTIEELSEEQLTDILALDLLLHPFVETELFHNTSVISLKDICKTLYLSRDPHIMNMIDALSIQALLEINVPALIQALIDTKESIHFEGDPKIIAIKRQIKKILPDLYRELDKALAPETKEEINTIVPLENIHRYIKDGSSYPVLLLFYIASYGSLYVSMAALANEFSPNDNNDNIVTMLQALFQRPAWQIRDASGALIKAWQKTLVCHPHNKAIAHSKNLETIIGQAKTCKKVIRAALSLFLILDLCFLFVTLTSKKEKDLRDFTMSRILTDIGYMGGMCAFLYAQWVMHRFHHRLENYDL